MIDNKEIGIDPLETPNVIIAPMSKHEKGISVVDDVLYVSTVSELVTSLPIIKNNLSHASLFPGCIEKCYCCEAKPNGCKLLKEGVQRLMNNHIILVEKVLSNENLFSRLICNI